MKIKLVLTFQNSTNKTRTRKSTRPALVLPCLLFVSAVLKCMIHTDWLVPVPFWTDSFFTEIIRRFVLMHGLKSIINCPYEAMISPDSCSPRSEREQLHPSWASAKGMIVVVRDSSVFLSFFFFTKLAKLHHIAEFISLSHCVRLEPIM